MMKNQVSVIFMLAGILFTTCLLLANILAVKIIQIGPFAAPAGVLIFPVAYILNDVIAEVWGYKKARLIIWAGFAMNILMVVFFSLSIILAFSHFLDGSVNLCQNTGIHPENSICQHRLLPGWFISECLYNEQDENIQPGKALWTAGYPVDNGR